MVIFSNKDTGDQYQTNGMSHILLRDDIYHEYRVVDGDQYDKLMISRWEEH